MVTIKIEIEERKKNNIILSCELNGTNKTENEAEIAEQIKKTLEEL